MGCSSSKVERAGSAARTPLLGRVDPQCVSGILARDPEIYPFQYYNSDSSLWQGFFEIRLDGKPVASIGVVAEGAINVSLEEPSICLKRSMIKMDVRNMIACQGEFAEPSVLIGQEKKKKTSEKKPLNNGRRQHPIDQSG